MGAYTQATNTCERTPGLDSSGRQTVMALDAEKESACVRHERNKLGHSTGRTEGTPTDVPPKCIDVEFVDRTDK